MGISDLPRASVGEVRQATRVLWNRKECLHPQADRTVCTKVIDAHTVQRSGALRQIVDSKNFVQTFYQGRRDDRGQIFSRSVGWREASTFSGFCSVHDNVFSPVERNPFIATPQQCFLLSYRSVCFELYQKKGSERSNSTMTEMMEHGLDPDSQQELRRRMSLLQAGTQKGRAEAEAAKQRMDQQLLGGDYSEWEWFVVTFEGPLEIASCGAVSPNVDLGGRELQRLHDHGKELQWMTVNIVPTETGGSIVLGYLREHDAPKRFVADLMSLDGDRLAQVLPQFVFAYIENTYFSNRWFDSLSDDKKSVVVMHAGNPNAYYHHPVYAGADIVSWRIASRLVVQAA